MRRWHIQHIFICLLFLICHHIHLYAQKSNFDSSYIYQFEKSNVVEIYPGISSTRFNFTARGALKNDFSLVANKSGNVGAYMSYKWVSISYSWAIPGTALDKNVKLQYTSLGFNFRIYNWSIRPFYKKYNGLLIPEKPGSNNFKPFRNIEFSDAGVDVYYFFNRKRFSIGAANSFSEKQIKSAGSIFIKVTPMWQRINWSDPSRDQITDSTTFNLLAYNPEWFSLVARVGYGYNAVFKKGNWNISPVIIFGGGALKEINTGFNKLQLVTDIQAGIRAGYNGDRYYFYLQARWGNLQTNLFIKNLHQVNTNLSLLAGYRYRSLKKKILGIL